MDQTLVPTVAVQRPSSETTPVVAPPRPPISGPSVGGRRKTASGRGIWLVLLLDVMVVAWMVVAGAWFDHRGLLNVITLGGHHQIVAGLALLSFLLLAGLAVSTEGFTRATSAELVLRAAANVLAAVALAGLLSIVLLVLLVGTFAGLMVKLFLR